MKARDSLSREIAELTGKQHKDVMRDIRNMLDQLAIDSAQFCAVYKDQQLIDRPCFNLDRELTLTLVSGYDIPLRHRVVTRLAELENAPKHLIPQSLPEALRLAAGLDLPMSYAIWCMAFAYQKDYIQTSNIHSKNEALYYL